MEGLVYFTVDKENCRVPKKKKTTAKAEGGGGKRTRRIELGILERSEMKGWQIDACLSMYKIPHGKCF